MQKDWIKFYKDNEAPTEPSSFARFIMDYDLDGVINVLTDLGCGNGRDSFYLGKKFNVAGIDPNLDEGAKSLDTESHVNFTKASWQQVKTVIKYSDIVYSRFFLHAIPWSEVEDIIDLTPNYFIAEARAVGDKPVVYPEHERHYINYQDLMVTLIRKGFNLIHAEKSRGLAPYKGEDPLVVRIIAKRI